MKNRVCVLIFCISCSFVSYSQSSGIGNFQWDPAYSYGISGIASDSILDLFRQQGIATKGKDVLTISVEDFSRRNNDSSNLTSEELFLVWGHNNGDLSYSTISGQTTLSLLERKWLIHSVNEQNVPFPTQVRFRLPEQYRDTTQLCFLVIDRSGNGNFSLQTVEIVENDRIDSAGNVFFSNVTWDTDKNGKDVFGFLILSQDTNGMYSRGGAQDPCYAMIETKDQNGNPLAGVVFQYGGIELVTDNSGSTVFFTIPPDSMIAIQETVTLAGCIASGVIFITCGNGTLSANYPVFQVVLGGVLVNIITVTNVCYSSPAAIENFTARVENLDNAALYWDVLPNGIQPNSFQIKRNGLVINSIAGTERTYLDTNLDEGSYTYQIIAHYENNTILRMSDILMVTVEDLDYALPVNFECVVENMDVLLFWNILPGEEMPVSFQIRRDGNSIWETQDSLTYDHIDPNVAEGTYTYRLYAHYANGMVANLLNEINVTVFETSDSITIGAGMELIVDLLKDSSYCLDSIGFACAADANSMNLTWEIAASAIQPVSFTVERNGEAIANLSGSQRVYVDANLEVGTYVYALNVFYSVSIERPLKTKRSACTIENCE